MPGPFDALLTSLVGRIRPSVGRMRSPQIFGIKHHIDEAFRTVAARCSANGASRVPARSLCATVRAVERLPLDSVMSAFPKREERLQDRGTAYPESAGGRQFGGIEVWR